MNTLIILLSPPWKKKAELYKLLEKVNQEKSKGIIEK